MSGGGACACRSGTLREVAQRSRHDHECCFRDVWVPIPHLPLCNPEGSGHRLQGPPGRGRGPCCRRTVPLRPSSNLLTRALSPGTPKTNLVPSWAPEPPSLSLADARGAKRLCEHISWPMSLLTHRLIAITTRSVSADPPRLLLDTNGERPSCVTGVYRRASVSSVGTPDPH